MALQQLSYQDRSCQGDRLALPMDQEGNTQSLGAGGRRLEPNHPGKQENASYT